MNGKLYIVATPIGNLDDITYRAVNTLKEVDLIAAEDTRHTLKLLNHLNISKPLISYYKENEKIKSNCLIDKLKEGQNIAVVSDAGTPGISDPGEEIIKKAIEENIDIIPIPGACAAINSLICSGFSTKEFCFIGFLSAKKSEKVKKLEELKNETKTLIFYEAPHKIIDTLEIMLEVFGDRDISIGREITKIHEEFLRGRLSEIITKVPTKGEMVIIVKGSSKSEKEIEIENLNALTIEEHYKFYEEKGYSKKEIIKMIAKDRDVKKDEIYKKFI
ncbi:MAG: 16S rRNA (cytidine(1402)-2'-O)-methyltransferase [Clostridia bacterium]|nr:16S rRNA (cytidine(1402)-2'-O)-methyltransferase [Clostridia bacterium]MBR3152227.1 16S rRNA (cytidine(1402)-2'-O)-methyltransferase [Clostridia bacterium]MBR3152236.1 16S rRNA (cytidine(1402)-2'-O)-methyltransferase [Clostridia bacterium]